MTTNTNKRIETMAATMGKAIAKLRKTDPAAADAMSAAAQQLAEAMRAGRV